MTSAFIIFGIVVICVVIVVCTLILLGCCLWPLVEEHRKEKQLQRPPMTFDYLNFGYD
ncbi:hypothetical protein I4U23_014737 [Adineta vaga]|nr:hypothetical protein I4U23_014737 [Adineta vaga]